MAVLSPSSGQSEWCWEGGTDIGREGKRKSPHPEDGSLVLQNVGILPHHCNVIKTKT